VVIAGEIANMSMKPAESDLLSVTLGLGYTEFLWELNTGDSPLTRSKFLVD
jgi:hypothetical protein